MYEFFRDLYDLIILLLRRMSLLYTTTTSEMNYNDIFIQNPIDQFFILGSCSGLTNFIWHNIHTIYPVLIILFFLLGLHTYANKFNALYNSLYSITSTAISLTQGYTSYLIYLFLIILSFNFFGMVPFSLAVTSFALTTAYFSFISFIGLNIIALSLHNEKFVNIFLPAGTPIMISWFLIILEAISYFIRILSLAIRLFANILAGHALIKILGSFAWLASGIKLFGIGILLIPWLVLFIIMFLELLICTLQSYVFITLVSLYINDIIDIH